MNFQSSSEIVTTFTLAGKKKGPSRTIYINHNNVLVLFKYKYIWIMLKSWWKNTTFSFSVCNDATKYRRRNHLDSTCWVWMFFLNTFKPQPPCKHRLHSGMAFVIYEVARVAEVRVAGLFNKPTKLMTSSKLKTLPKRIHCEQSKPHIFL